MPFDHTNLLLNVLKVKKRKSFFQPIAVRRWFSGYNAGSAKKINIFTRMLSTICSERKTAEIREISQLDEKAGRKKNLTVPNVFDDILYHGAVFGICLHFLLHLLDGINDG